jgi:hypothetical protein
MHDQGAKALQQSEWGPVVSDPGCLGGDLVRHEANLASGGNVAHIEIGTFLSSGQAPEHQELLRLIGTLLDNDTGQA